MKTCIPSNNRLDCRLHIVTTRLGFTLIELLVVISLIMIMAGLGVMFLPRIGEQDRAARGGAMLQSWLNTARAKALLYKSPVGIRLIRNASNHVPQAVYIEQLEDYTGTTDQAALTSGAAQDEIYIQNLAGVDFTAGGSPSQEWMVQPGDYIEVLGGGLLHRIKTLTEDPTPISFASGKNLLKLASPLPFSISSPGTLNYRIIRSPRPFGEELLMLPDSVGVDLNMSVFTQGTSVDSPVPLTQDLDILFAPSGALIMRGGSADIISLWVRDTTDPADPTLGEPSIIAVYTKTGQTAAHPPSDDPSDRYKFVKDGRSSGR